MRGSASRVQHPNSNPNRTHHLLDRLLACFILEEDCSTKTCTHGATCKVVDRKAQCTCSLQCPSTYNPVCGSDLKTYDNECKMNETACNAKEDISVLVRDKCG